MLALDAVFVVINIIKISYKIFYNLLRMIRVYKLVDVFVVCHTVDLSRIL